MWRTPIRWAILAASCRRCNRLPATGRRACAAGEIERVLDVVAQKQLRLETAGASYTSVMASYAGELDRLFGTPGGAGALDSILNTFTQSLQTLVNDPGSSSARAAVLDNAGILASQIGRISESVQALRTDAEGRIGLAVDRANELLSGIAGVNARIVANRPLADPGLLDERDRMINELSQLMDVQTFERQDGSVSLSTTAGLTLFNGVNAVTLSFDGRSSLAPQSSYSTDAGARGVGTIKATSANGVAIDVIGDRLIRSGEIAAAIEMRDDVLVEAQRQLDELAAGMARALSDKPAPVTAAGTGYAIDVSGMQPGNTISLDYTDAAGVVRRITLVATAGGAPSPFPSAQIGDPDALIVPFDLSAGLDAVVTEIGATLAARGIAVSHPSGNLLQFADGAADVARVSGAVTVTGLTSLGQDPQLAFFVDGATGDAFTGSFEGGSQLTGFAQRLVVNPDLVDDPSALVKITAATPQGDFERPQFLLDALTSSKRSFSGAAGLTGATPVSETVTGFARRIVEHQGAGAESAARLNEGQSVALAAIESRFAETSGVNIDQEMAQLVTLQMAYGANARVMTAVRDMMDMLMRM